MPKLLPEGRIQMLISVGFPTHSPGQRSARGLHDLRQGERFRWSLGGPTDDADAEESGGVVDGDRNLERNGGVWGVGIEMGFGMT